jgi:hypothetical protein
MRQLAVCRRGNGSFGTKADTPDCLVAQRKTRLRSRPQIIEVPMRVKFCAAAITAVTAIAVLLTAWPAEAAQKKRRLAVEQPTRTIYYNSAGRRVVIVHRRSFLDAGTEPNPGERSYISNVLTPTYSPTAPIDHTSGKGCCWPMPGPFEPGYSGFGVR